MIYFFQFKVYFLLTNTAFHPFQMHLFDTSVFCLAYLDHCLLSSLGPEAVTSISVPEQGHLYSALLDALKHRGL